MVGPDVVEIIAKAGPSWAQVIAIIVVIALLVGVGYVLFTKAGAMSVNTKAPGSDAN